MVGTICGKHLAAVFVVRDRRIESTIERLLPENALLEASKKATACGSRMKEACSDEASCTGRRTGRQCNGH